jgi:hypothetical protein
MKYVALYIVENEIESGVAPPKIWREYVHDGAVH